MTCSTHKFHGLEIAESGPRDAGAGDGDGECRCLCGSLLGRIVDGGIEIMCRRCKRTFVVRIDSESEAVA